MEDKILITTTETVNGKYPKKILGLVRGNTIRTRWIGRDIGAGLKTIIGGEIKGYTKMMSDARDQAIERMKENAKELGANAIVMTRITTSSIMKGASEILAYGTAAII